MAAVKARASIATGLDLVPADGQSVVGAEVILAGSTATPLGAQVPAHPVGDAAVAVVAQGILGLAEEVVGGLGCVGCSAAGVAEG